MSDPLTALACIVAIICLAGIMQAFFNFQINKQAENLQARINDLHKQIDLLQASAQMRPYSYEKYIGKTSDGKPLFVHKEDGTLS